MSASPQAGTLRSARWLKPALLAVGIVVVAVLLVLLARYLREQSGVQSFLARYPGASSLPSFAPTGFPAWLAWQHGLNSFFLLFIISSGLQVHYTKRPTAFFTRNNSGVIRTKGTPKRISLQLWLHLTVDSLFVLNGVVFYVLLFSTRQWTRVVPTSWDVLPNAASAILQYASFDWPKEDGWTSYNGIQLLSYCFVIFLLAPAALLTGLRMSPAWSRGLKRFDKVFPLESARALHFPIMVVFCAFIVVHVLLVLATGAMRNLNHMYGLNDGTSWLGPGIFIATLVVMAAAYAAARPLVLRALASTMGRVGR